MTLPDAIASLVPEVTEWRRDIHAHPETAFEERRTSDLVARLLGSWGIQVHRGIGRTGVVGVLRAGESERSIALRADMDALPIREATGAPHASTVDGTMHACGHDGHTAMLLGAAKHLAATSRFDGVVHFIFQPAEENEGGARAMLEDGLLREFRVDKVYGMHNRPGIPTGRFVVRAGPLMASYDQFEIHVVGRGCHAATPELGIDPVPAAASLISALVALPSRSVGAREPSVLTVTQVQAGSTWNVVPDEAVVRGTVRCLSPAVRDRIEARVGDLVRGIASAHGCEGRLTYERRYPATVNSGTEAEACASVASAVVGPDRVSREMDPVMGSEDFAFLLNERPGCYVFLGSGEDSPPLHSPNYDFPDEIIPWGVAYWTALAESRLSAKADW